VKITRILEASLPLRSDISNALVNFADHTVSLLAIVTDRRVSGRPLIGLSFNSIGRYAQRGILQTRLIPRLLAADPESLLAPGGARLSPERILACSLRNEKPGGHGDRAHAAAALEMAVWDLNAKLADEPACAAIARHVGRPAADAQVAVYAAGGYYYDGEDEQAQVQALMRELQGCRDRGFTRFKIKIGGASLDQDLRRIDAALTVAGDGANLAVDANGRFDLATALAYGQALQPYRLMWFEEPGDPLDYALHAALADEYDGALATGENLFSHQDVKNLALFGGMRPGRDVFQMDPGLSHGITGLTRMLKELESRGFDRRQCQPHGGQLLNLHAVAGLGLGGSEVYPGVFQPLGGCHDGAAINDGAVRLPDAPGFGLERKANLIHEFARMLA